MAPPGFLSNRQTKVDLRDGKPVIPINDLVDGQYSPEEADLRCRLAGACRIIDRYQWNYGIYNHLTVRCPDNPNEFLINPLGPNYEEVTASSLIRVDAEGNLLDRGSTEFSIAQSGFCIHSAIHEARPDINCVIHVHTHAGAAISTLKTGFLPISQEATHAYGLITYYPYDGVFLDKEYGRKMAEKLGRNDKFMILNNHGLISCGKTVEEAWFQMFNMIYACETQWRAQAAAGGDENRYIVPEMTAVKQAGSVFNGEETVNTSELKWDVGQLEFEAEMRYLDLRGFKTGYNYRFKPKFHI